MCHESTAYTYAQILKARLLSLENMLFKFGLVDKTNLTFFNINCRKILSIWLSLKNSFDVGKKHKFLTVYLLRTDRLTVCFVSIFRST